MTIPPNFVPTNNESVNLKTGIVTEAETGVTMTIAQYEQALVDAHKAHNLNEAAVEMGLPQNPALPASPDGAGNPTFTVPATPAPAPVAIVAPHPSAPPAVHLSFAQSLLKYSLMVLKVAGAAARKSAR